MPTLSVFSPKHFASEKVFDDFFPGHSTAFAFCTTSLERQSDIIPYQILDAVLTSGLKFNHILKNLLAKYFIHVDFVVPFSKYGTNAIVEIGAYIE